MKVRVRIAGAAMVMVALLAACSSSSSPSSSSSGTTAPPDVDVQAATACKSMEKALTDTADGSAISGPDAQQMRDNSGLLIRTPDGRTPNTLDALPKWYRLGTTQLQLLVAISGGDPTEIATFTNEARAGCATIPEAAQQEAKYTPVPTTP